MNLRRHFILFTNRACTALSAVALIAAFASAVLVLIPDVLLVIGIDPRTFPIHLRSSTPLIMIGLSYFFVQITLQRTLLQHVLCILVAVAFVLWGLEQFLTNTTAIKIIDDIVVFLFVLDLAFVIRERLQEHNRSKASWML
jgi:hypothetical protein